MSLDAFAQQVAPVMNPEARKLCTRPYHGHPKGCPNYGKRVSCPPAAPLLCEALDLAYPVYAIWNAFDFGAHISRMRRRHPEWSQRQVECCLYWQGTARKELRRKVEAWLSEPTCRFEQVVVYLSELRVLYCPEACGVDVTATMASIGIELEWPPRTVAYQVALVGTKGEST